MPAPKDPEKYKLWKENMSKARKGRIVSDITRQKLSNANKGKGHPAWNKGISPSEKTRTKLRKKHTGKILSETHKANISKSGKGLKRSPTTRQQISKARTGITVPEKTLRRMCEVNIGGFWYGNIRYYDGLQYCEKFNENFKERVRAFFGYVCPECGTPQNEIRLAVHHVNFNKHSCCDSEAPRLFIPLCPGTCHGKTNGNKEYWEKHFTEMIMEYYQGKCYFTKEEMKLLQV